MKSRRIQTTTNDNNNKHADKNKKTNTQSNMTKHDVNSKNNDINNAKNTKMESETALISVLNLSKGAIRLMTTRITITMHILGERHTYHEYDTKHGFI